MAPQDVIEQRDGRFYLEVMGGAPAANIATRPDNGSDCLGNQRPDQGQTRYLVPKAKTETASLQLFHTKALEQR